MHIVATPVYAGRAMSVYPLSMQLTAPTPKI
jgi:hypothetical protein